MLGRSPFAQRCTRSRMFHWTTVPGVEPTLVMAIMSGRTFGCEAQVTPISFHGSPTA